MPTEKKVILDLCGGTGAWSRPYAEAGYDVRNITLPDFDVRTYEPPEKVDGILAAPPCTHLSGSGARWWAAKGQQALWYALSIVDACLRFVVICKPNFWALENPVGRLIHYIGKPKMYFNPCDYGDPYTKKTCLWGDFNEPKKNPIEPEIQNRIWYASPSDHRSRIRSITPPGFAQAFFRANQ